MNIELKKAIVFFDLETTGTDVKNDYIVDLSMIKIKVSGEKESKQARFKPPIPIPKEASDVHGITDEIVKDCKPFAQYAKGILAFIEGCDIAGFNSNKFDNPLLYNELKRAGLTWAWQMSNFIDVRNIFTIKEPRTLAAAYKFYCNEDLAGAHDSTNDVEATVRVFNMQLERYPELKEMTIESLAFMSNYDKKIVDIGGVFAYNEAGQIVFNLGKHSGKVATTEKGYLQWMVKPSSGFDSDVIRIAQSLLYK